MTQAVVAVLITAGLVGAVVGWVTPRKHRKTLAGTAAKFAQALGGSKETPMQA